MVELKEHMPFLRLLYIMTRLQLGNHQYDYSTQRHNVINLQIGSPSYHVHVILVGSALNLKTDISNVLREIIEVLTVASLASIVPESPPVASSWDQSHVLCKDAVSW